MKFTFFILSVAYVTLCTARPGDKIVIKGAPAHINTDDPSVIDASTFAASQIANSYNTPKVGLYKIISAERQVVSGSLFTLRIQAGTTDCEKVKENSKCKVDPNKINNDPEFGEYIVKVWDQPWMTPRFKMSSVEPADDKTKSKKKPIDYKKKNEEKKL